MKQSHKTSVALSENEVAILDATARRLDISRTEVVRHLVLYHGLCGGDFPLTSKILAMPDRERARLTREIRERAESDEPVKPQSFRTWVKDVLGSDDPESLDRGADALLRQLLDDSDA